MAPPMKKKAVMKDPVKSANLPQTSGPMKPPILCSIKMNPVAVAASFGPISSISTGMANKIGPTTPAQAPLITSKTTREIPERNGNVKTHSPEMTLAQISNNFLIPSLSEIMPPIMLKMGDIKVIMAVLTAIPSTKAAKQSPFVKASIFCGNNIPNTFGILAAMMYVPAHEWLQWTTQPTSNGL